MTKQNQKQLLIEMMADDEKDGIYQDQEYYHTKEAATAHLAGVGLTFEGYCSWLGKKYPQMILPVDADYCEYKASDLRQYIRDNHQLNEKQ